MAATDGYRLSVRSIVLDKASVKEPMTVIVPAEAWASWRASAQTPMRSGPVQVIVTQSRNQALFQHLGQARSAQQLPPAELVSQLIDARFPDYRAIIPKTHTTRTVVDTAPSCSRPCVSPSSLRDNANIIRLAVVPGNGEKEGQVRLTASSQRDGRQCQRT